MKKLLIFDFDGTLFDSITDVMICFNKVLQKHGFPVLTREEYVNRVGGNIDEIVSAILGDEYNSQENIELVKNSYEKVYAKSERLNTVPFTGAFETLKQFQENDFLLAINSNRKTDSIKYFVNKYFKDIDFIQIEGHNIGHPSKPDPYGVNKIIKKANVESDECIYIGDSSKDIETAKNAEIDCIIVKWGYGCQDDYDDEYILKAVDDISEIIEIVK